MWLNSLPFEDKGANAELDTFLKYVKNPDGFSLQAWVAGEIFARAVEDTSSRNDGDVNSITRANLLKSVRAMHDFDANGLVPKIDVGRKVGSSCVVGMQVEGRQVRAGRPGRAGDVRLRRRQGGDDHHRRSGHGVPRIARTAVARRKRGVGAAEFPAFRAVW